MNPRAFFKICYGILYTYIGLVLFLTGVNVGFSSLGAVLGSELFEGFTKYLLIPLSMCLGWFIISAEPAVYVLQKQIESVSAGAIPGKAIKYSLSIAIAAAMGIAMLRVLAPIGKTVFERRCIGFLKPVLIPHNARHAELLVIQHHFPRESGKSRRRGIDLLCDLLEPYSSGRIAGRFRLLQ